ncbi:TerD family protein [Pseudoclavibacter helvolus]|uniref:TerD family protein n=1 Tax=Pseudoclavibacter helvolus TaxID=255205 RepID=UPI0024ACEDCB|nr:TerD family protein [Pseudoclavibacter helvolus]
MAVLLSKGSTVSLTKEAGPRGLTSVTVGLGWDAESRNSFEFDLDASAIVLDSVGRALSDSHLVFYNNLQSPEGGVTHTGDNTDGQGEGDDEQLIISLTTLPETAQSVVFVVSIHDAAARGQAFDQVQNAFIRVVNNEDGQELARFDLASGAYGQDTIVFGEVYREGADWKFRAIGDSLPGGFVGTLRNYGINV